MDPRRGIRATRGTRGTRGNQAVNLTQRNPSTKRTQQTQVEPGFSQFASSHSGFARFNEGVDDLAVQVGYNEFRLQDSIPDDWEFDTFVDGYQQMAMDEEFDVEDYIPETQPQQQQQPQPQPQQQQTEAPSTTHSKAKSSVEWWKARKEGGVGWLAMVVVVGGGREEFPPMDENLEFKMDNVVWTTIEARTQAQGMDPIRERTGDDLVVSNPGPLRDV
ncbi:hypothetical protein QVD17_30947 [Tagetes erecta]|uniref:Uncharacterized protein n=1 Tax=Tagetes erecta TaxID=13708 RepID=A0AAD8K2G5_TARER|nr:hypothetical protein QVD17_30947 [Tagetes erecta]